MTRPRCWCKDECTVVHVMHLKNVKLSFTAPIVIFPNFPVCRLSVIKIDKNRFNMYNKNITLWYTPLPFNAWDHGTSSEKQDLSMHTIILSNVFILITPSCFWS